MFRHPISRRTALCGLAAAGLAALPVREAPRQQPKYVAVCASSPCKFRNAGEIAPRRGTRAEAARDARNHTTKTGHETDVLKVPE